MNIECQILIVFFLNSNAAPRDLHSFPTRRSSDLAVVGVGLELAAGREDARPGRVLLERELVAERREDRKSTRLNSSHSSISYAVFCLKKKNDHCPIRQHLQHFTLQFMRRRLLLCF